jgi:hypothetical protein
MQKSLEVNAAREMHVLAYFANRKELFVGSIAEKIQGADGFNKSKSVLGLKRHDVGQSFRRIGFGPNHVSRQRTGKFVEIGWGRRGRGSW